MKANHLLFLLLLIGFASHAQQEAGLLTWNNTENTISISYPKEWTELKLNGQEIIAFTAPKDNAEDHYPDMLVLRAFPDSGEKNIDRLKDYARSTLNPEFKFKISFSKKIIAKDKEYIKTIAEKGDGKVVLVMYTLLQEDKIFFLTLNVEKKNYERYKSVGEHAFESLAVKQAWIIK
ncbi:MAG: hypothetical protein JJE25_04365 [Bacteroidia bacterium]|nr:hypothetical protein [Bacteroidia bacterium]